MSEVVSFPTDDGSSILVEVDGPGGGRVTRGGRAVDAVIDAGSSLEHALAGLGPAIQGIVAQLRAAADWPDEVEIEFGVKLSADANAIIARTSAEANFTISLKWSREQLSGGEPPSAPQDP
jgi:hypothetical protein